MNLLIDEWYYEWNELFAISFLPKIWKIACSEKKIWNSIKWNLFVFEHLICISYKHILVFCYSIYQIPNLPFFFVFHSLTTSTIVWIHCIHSPWAVLKKLQPMTYVPVNCYRYWIYSMHWVFTNKSQHKNRASPSTDN